MTNRKGRIMKNQKFLSALTVINLGLLLILLIQARPVVAADIPRVIRGHALEIVDDQGRVRASVSVLPEDPKVKWKGKPYPETVLLRLITAEGRPNVKLGASKSGAGLLIGGESDPTYVQILAEGGESTVKLVNKAGIERVIKQ
jgi:hypothetical protein